MRNQITRVVLIFLLAGCGGRNLLQPPVADTLELPGTLLPASVSVYIPPDIADKSTHFSYYYHSFWFPEGELIARTALRAFSQYFATVKLRTELPRADLAVKVRGYSSLNPLVGSYYVDVFAECFSAEGESLEALKASQVADADYYTYTALYETTYLKAFQKLANQIAHSEKCKSALRSAETESR